MKLVVFVDNSKKCGGSFFLSEFLRNISIVALSSTLDVNR